MKIRPATPADFEEITAIHIKSWQDAYADDLPKEFISGALGKTLTQHWRSIEIEKNDIVLVAEQDDIFGYSVLSRRIVWDDISVIVQD